MPDDQAAEAAYTRAYSIVSGEREILEYAPEITELLVRTGNTRDITLSPGYFLHRNELRSAPVLVMARQGGRLSGVLYARHRRSMGLKTGVVEVGDHFGDGGVIAREGTRARILSEGSLQLLSLPGVHTVRASSKIAGEDEIRSVEPLPDAKRIASRVFCQPVQHNLQLEPTFDQFLSKLGSHTRRNFRVYRKRVQQQGWKYIHRLGEQEVDDAFRTLEVRQGKHKSSRHYIGCCREALRAVPGAFYAGLSTAAGEWVSLAAGWMRDEQYFMLVQLNHAAFLRDSVSIVMRSQLIEQLIEEGVTRVNFVGGSSEMLGRFCVTEQCVHYLFEKRNLFYPVRRALGQLLFGSSLVSRIHHQGASVIESPPLVQPSGIGVGHASAVPK